MCEILIKAESYIHPDPVIDRSGVHKKGDIISIYPDGWSSNPNWALSDYPYSRSGKFVLVKCPDITVAEAITWSDPWKDNFGYSVVSSDPSQGLYVLNVFEQNPGAIGQNNLTQGKIQSFLSGWGCTEISFSANSVQFTFSLWNAVQSLGFWGYTQYSLISFSLVSFNSSTGIGRITANCTTLLAYFVGLFNMSLNSLKGIAENIIDSNGGTLINWSGAIATFDIGRVVLLQKFQSDVKRKAQAVYIKSRWCVDAGVVDSIIASGGVITTTRTQVLNYLKDKMA